MANFNTHVSVAFFGSTGTALLALNSQLITLLETPWLIFLGTMGGLLPDIDSDNTKQVRVVFFLLAMMTSLTLLSEGSILQGIPSLFPSSKVICHVSSLEFSSIVNELSSQCLPYSLILIALSAFIFVRYILLSLFKSLTVHRGVFHSILAALFFALLTTCVSYYFLKQESLFAWLSGLFTSIGFIIHLLLDEIFSVDLSNSRLKRSFGTALKLYGYHSLSASLLMLLCIVGLYKVAPPTAIFIQAIQTADISIKKEEFNIEKILSQPKPTWIDYLRSNLKEIKDSSQQT